MKRLIILGAGGYGRTVADVAAQCGEFDEIRFLDDGQTGDDILGKCGDYHRHADGNTWFYPAFGNNQARLNWVDTLVGEGYPVATIVHPAAYVSPTAAIETGTVILPKAVINTDCRILIGCIVNLGAIIDHGCVIGEGAHICLGAIIKAENRIPAGMKIEAGEVVANRTYPL